MGIVRQIYFYTVCLVTLIMVIGGGVASVMSVSDILFPDPYHQTYDNYKRMIESDVIYKEDGTAQHRIVDEKQVRENYEAQKKDDLEHNALQAKNSLVKNLAWIVVPLPFFLWSGRIIRKEKSSINSKEEQRLA